MTETFTREPENYRPKDIVKYRHLSRSGNRALEPCQISMMKLLTMYYFRRTFAIDFDRVLNMPLTSHNVYFHFVYALKSELYHLLL